MIRNALSAVARNESLGGILSRAPIARDVVKRVVGGDTIESALGVVADLADRGFVVSLERAAPVATDPEEAARVTDEYLALIDAVAASGLAGVCEIAVVPETVGLGEGDRDGAQRVTAIAEHAHRRHAAAMVGTGPAVDVPAAIAVVTDLRARGIDIGVTLPAVLRSTERDCAHLDGGGVRLVKGSQHPESGAAHGQPIEIDKAFVRCAKTLLRGAGEPSFATHDPRLIEILESLVDRYGRPRQTYEYTFFMGRMEATQERLLEQGDRVRIYVPYGPQWFERLVGGLAEQPSTVAAALRSLLPGS